MLDKDKAGREPEVGDDNQRKPGPSALLPLTARVAVGLSTVLALAVVVASPVFAQAAPPPPAVTISLPLQKEITEWDQFTGQFAPVDSVEIRARVSGYLTEIHFTDGQIVKKGDLLFVIDPRPYEATLATMRAQLAQAEAQVELATRQLGR